MRVVDEDVDAAVLETARDDLLRESAREIGVRFDRVVLYEDSDRRGRSPGEVPALLHEELIATAPSAQCTVVRTVDEAVPAALAMARPGEVVLLLYEKIEPVLALLHTLGAEIVPDRRVSFPLIGASV